MNAEPLKPQLLLVFHKRFFIYVLLPIDVIRLLRRHLSVPQQNKPPCRLQFALQHILSDSYFFLPAADYSPIVCAHLQIFFYIFAGGTRGCQTLFFYSVSFVTDTR